VPVFSAPPRILGTCVPSINAKAPTAEAVPSDRAKFVAK
jgi:hypothetical protein